RFVPVKSKDAVSPAPSGDSHRKCAIK
ncbi:unnamed protein product, partial [Oikopleura dioica]